jgi:hypothetical protein
LDDGVHRSSEGAVAQNQRRTENRMTLKQSKLAVTLMLGLMIFAAQAYGVPTLSFKVDGGATTFCADNAACDLDSTAGVVAVVAPLPGGFTVNVTTGATKPTLGTAGQPHMDLNSINIQSTGGTHDLTLGFSEVGFTKAPTGLTGLLGGALTAPAGSTVTAEAYYHTGNTLFGLGALAFSMGPFGPGAFSGTASGAGPASGPYSLTQYLKLHTTGPANFSANFDLSTPEPASVALLAGILLVTGFSLRRRIRRA